LDFQHLVADDELRAELLDRIGELIVVPRGSSDVSLEGFDVPSDAFAEVSPSALEAGVRQMREGDWDTDDGDSSLEAIVQRFTRPVFFVSGTGFTPPTDGFADSEVLMDRLQGASDQIAATVPSVGRIDLTNHDNAWVGTGWVVAPDIVVTNRHVAREFAEANKRGGYGFKAAAGGRKMQARVDLRREYDCAEESPVQVREVLWIEPADGPDVALLRVATRDDNGLALPEPIPLMTQPEVDRTIQSWIAVVGYPAWSPYNSPQDQQRIFDGIYEVKRLAPGTVMAVSPGGRLTHDATTLGGNSGSAVVDLLTGKAVALHYGGTEGKRNEAVQAPVVADRLTRLAPPGRRALWRRVASRPAAEGARVPAERGWVKEFQTAAATFDIPGLSALSHEYVDHLYGAPAPPSSVRRVMQILRQNLCFEDLEAVADAALAYDLDAATVRRQYAQALVDGGNPTAALRMYTDLAADRSASAHEVSEAQGGVGRCYKELFLACTEPTRRNAFLRRAILAYLQPYQADNELCYHGVNAVALLARAGRDDIDVGIDVRADDLARRVLHTVDVELEQDDWTDVTAAEALIALGSHSAAVERAEAFLKTNPSGFTVASFLRQLQVVWQLDTRAAPGDDLFPILRSALLDLHGGQVVVDSHDVRSDRVDNLPDRDHLHAILGETRFQTLTWYRNGLLRCRAVARIQTVNDDGRGTGFLVAGTDLHPDLPPLVLLTNGHVVPERLPPDDAVVVFHGLDCHRGHQTTFRVRRQCWYEPSESPHLDTSILELDGYPNGVEPVPFARSIPAKPLKNQRAYLIGHPSAASQPQFSLQDNILLDYDHRLLHYRAPSEPGSSGSPIFDQQWQLLGLHHAGGHDIPRLNSTGGTYAANEGIRLDAIIAQLRAHPPKT
jgi:V8-like Glu-specific endopeptidase